MGKFVARLASRKKAKRWKKGQSASSNPESKTHREQARSCFFQPNLGSNLTTDVLRKHDAIQGSKMEEDPALEVDNASETTGTTFKTVETFATDFSHCSNMSFGRLLNHFQSNSIIHKEMLAVLAAVTEVLKQSGGTESSTEYYAALMTTLEAAETPESVSAILSLLGMCMRTVPKNVLKLQFGKATEILLQILTKFVAEENFLIIRHCIGCLTILLRCQETVVWSNPSTMQVMDVILTFTIHAKPKLRKAAQHAICAILKGSDIMTRENPPAHHPAALSVAKYFLAQMQIAGQPGQRISTLYVVTLLKDVIDVIPKTYVKALCEGLLSFMTVNDVKVTINCFQTFHGLFESRPPETVLSSQLNAQIISALYDYQPAPGDTFPTLAWLAVMQEAHCNLFIGSKELCCANIPKIVEKCVDLWLSDKQEVLTGSSHTIKILLERCLQPICVEEGLAKQHKSTLRRIINTIRRGMKIQYHTSWHHVLHLLAVILQIAGPVCQEEARQILIDLTELRELREEHKFVYNTAIEYAVGAAVKSLGPEFILSVIPLQNASGEVDVKRSWLLPVLKDCTQNGSIQFFYDYLLPFARNCENKAKLLREKKEDILAHSNELLMSQTWSLLPSFCTNPPDVCENFKKIAEILGNMIVDQKDLRTFAMSALRKLIRKANEQENEAEKKELSIYAKNYLPMLANLYTTKYVGTDEEGQRLAAFETIKTYLTVTDKNLVGEMFDTALNKIVETKDNDFLRESLIDLVRLLTEYTDINRIKILYDKIVPTLKDDKHPKDQKKAYRFLEDICGSESEVCNQFVKENRKDIQKNVVKFVATVQKPSKGARLRCITNLVKCHPSLENTKFFKMIVPEAIMCIKEANKKCRESAYNLLNVIAEKFMGNEQHFSDYIDYVISGLEGEPNYSSATLLALSTILYQYSGTLGATKIQTILDQCLSLLVTPTRELAMAALSFINVYLKVLPSPTVAPQLRKIILGLTSMTEDCKRHFRQKVRDIITKLIRKFGVDTISAMVPASDVVMHKRLKNIRKIEARKQKVKEQKKANLNDSQEDDEFTTKRKPKTLEDILLDSDDDFEDVDTDKTNKNKRKKSIKQAWIQENEEDIADFADPSAAAKSISATNPGIKKSLAADIKKKDNGFKIAKDGRLIITDKDGSGDSGDEKNGKKKKKSKLPFENSDQEEDMELEEDDLKSVKSNNPADRKRKIAGSTIGSIFSEDQSMYKAGGSGIHRPLKKKQRTESVKGTGEEYRSKKGQGDVKLKGRPDPYAYIPLKRSTLNRRNKKKNASSQFDRYFSKSKKEKRQLGGKKRK